MKHPNLIGLFIAFTAGQVIQLLTCAMAHNLYVSDPVLMCLTVGVVATVVVILASIFTMMENGEKMEDSAMHTAKLKRDDIGELIPPIFFNNNKRKPLDTDPEDIDEIDRSTAKAVKK